MGEEEVKKGEGVGGGGIKNPGDKVSFTYYMFLLLISGCSFNILEVIESNKITTTIVIV